MKLSCVCLHNWVFTEIEGLKRKLSSKLAVNSPTFPPNWQVRHSREAQFFFDVLPSFAGTGHFVPCEIIVNPAVQESIHTWKK
jgi:hypothetical protein